MQEFILSIIDLYTAHSRTLTNIKEETKREGEVPKTEDGDPKE